MAIAPKEFQVSGIVNFLVQSGILSEGDAKVHDQEARRDKVSTLSYLASHKLIDSKVVAEKISSQFGLPLFDLDAIDGRNLPANRISEKLIRQHNALPLLVTRRS